MLWNTLILAVRAIRRNLMRSFLTVLGIVIGVAAVITMVTLGNGATQSIADQISKMGSNILMVSPGQRFGPGAASAPSFKIADVDAIKNQIFSAKWVAPVVASQATTVFQSNNWSTTVTGSNNDYFPAGNWELASGREFSEAEMQSGKSVCVIGETVREKLFGKQNPIGSKIRIQQFSCEVIGLLEPKGQSGMGHDQDDSVVMPIKTVQRRLTGNKDINRITVSASNANAINTVKNQLELLLRERRNISANEDDNFRVMDTRQITETLTGTTKVLTMLLGSVAAVSLLVGGIGIMNIMLVSVTERTREIGIRLAIGALEREVLLQFLIEAVVLSSIGGLIGLAIATGASITIARLIEVPYLFSPGINLLAFVFSAAIGVIFGFFPARRAAKLNPIDALRHE